MPDRIHPAVRPVVSDLAEVLTSTGRLVGLYATGSLGSGTFRPGVSDLDLVAALDRPLFDPEVEAVRYALRVLRYRHPLGPGLHVQLVPVDDPGDLADPGRRHLHWARARLTRRTMSGITRAELVRAARTVTGPPPRQLFPPVDDAAVRAAVRAELTGYWTTAAGWRFAWLRDFTSTSGC